MQILIFTYFSRNLKNESFGDIIVYAYKNAIKTKHLKREKNEKDNFGIKQRTQG